MRRLTAGLAATIVATTVAAADAGVPTGDGRGGFRLKRIGDFDSPVYVHGPKGAGDLVFVVEQAGRIRALKGDRPRGTFLDIHGRVSCCGERGLLSVAFPEWDDSRRFYVYFTDGQGDLRIVEYRRRRDGPPRARKGTAGNVLQIHHRAFANHNGGQAQFGPDGKLYLATGDGGSGGDPFENAQDRGSLLGKLLRINPKRAGPGKPYSTPRGNPYVGRRGRNEIWSRGLRNPWRFSFDRERIVIGDVGQELVEEVDYETLRGARRANFGWDNFEGTMPYEGGSLNRHDRPIHQYSSAGGSGNCSITGGYVSRNRKIRSLFGRYVYADYCRGQPRSLIPEIGGARDDRSLGLGTRPGISSFGEDARNRLYVASLSGPVWRLAPR
jgi:hypothetical protein